MENKNNSGTTIFGGLSEWIMGLSGRVDKEIKIYAEKMFWSYFGRYLLIGALLALGTVYVGIENESKFILFIGLMLSVYIILHGWDKARRQVMLIYGFGELISQVMDINRRLETAKETESVSSEKVIAESTEHATKQETKNDTDPGNSASSDPFGSWTCPKCGTKNLNSRKNCWRCEYEL